MTHAINSCKKLLSIDITKCAYSDDKELKRQRLKKKKRWDKRKEKKRKLKRERKKERKKKINKK